MEGHPKLSWFYGVIRKTRHKMFKSSPKYYYEIHEIYTHDNYTDLSWTESPVAAFGNSVDELRKTLVLMLSDSYKMPVYEIKEGRLVRLDDEI